MAIKKTLLQIVQNILSDMDSEPVNSLNDTIEAQQVASIVEDTFYNMVATRDIPEHHELIKLTALSDSGYPTHFQYNTNVKYITKVWYQNSQGFYREVCFVEPERFLHTMDSVQSDYVVVYDKNAGTTLRIRNDAQPMYYTSFDDNYIVMDSYEADIDSTLQNSKVRAYGSVLPVFEQTDDYVPDIDGVYFPYLIAESKSVAMSILKGQSDPKVEQAARRQKSYIQNDKYKTIRGNHWPDYGR